MNTAAAPAPAQHHRYYDLILAGFVAVLLCSNLIGTAKVAVLTLPLVGGAFVFGVGNIFFPISYIFGDVLTEVYGYARARRQSAIAGQDHNGTSQRGACCSAALTAAPPLSDDPSCGTRTQ